MALTINIWSRFEVVDANGVVYSGGRLSTEKPRTITTSTSDIHDQTHTVASSGIVKLFDIADDLADFEFLYVEATQDGLLQLVNKTAANFFTFQTIANIPTMIAGDSSLDSTGSVGAFDGVSDDLERIYWKNTSSASGTARVVAVT